MPQPDIEAAPIEQHMVLGAMIGGCVVLHGVGRHTVQFATFTEVLRASDPLSQHPSPVSAADRRRWLACDPSDRAAVLRAAHTRVEIDTHGQIHPVWRHRCQAGVA